DFSDIEMAKNEKKTGIILALQNAVAAEKDVRLFAILKKMGVNVIQLTYNERNRFADGATERTNSGLSDLGVEAVKAMNENGILIDLSHVGKQSTLEALEISKEGATVFTHGNPKGVCPSPRNKTDEELKKLAQRGGVTGI